jgi:competence protein ComFC
VKYNGNQKIAILFACLLYEQMIEVLSEEELFSNFIDPVVIPLPLSKERLKERGWNQAEIIAREIVKLNSSFSLNTTSLHKVKNTLPQTKLSKSERLKNLKNCFAIKDSDSKIEGKRDLDRVKIKNRNIILVDDVTTTGATILEAKKVLLNAGAKNVLAFTIAH